MDANAPVTLSFTDIDFSLIVYVLAALLIGGGGTYYIMKTDRPFTAIGFFIGALSVFIFFGLRWFDGFKLRQSISGVIDPNTPWPPVINYCPDFMSIVKDGNDFFCVDTNGVSKLPPWTPESRLIKVAEAGLRINNIPLRKDQSGFNYVTNYLMVGDTNGLTWEGIYDGRSTSARVPPFPKA